MALLAQLASQSPPGTWWRLLLAWIALLAASLVFHLGCETGTALTPVHLALVLLREGAWCGLVVWLAQRLLPSGRTARLLAGAAALILAMLMIAYRIYVGHRMEPPRFPGELFAAGEGLEYLRATGLALLDWRVVLFVLAPLAWAWILPIPPLRLGWRLPCMLSGGLVLLGLILTAHASWRPPWLQDRSACFRHHGAVVLAVSDAVLFVSSLSGTAAYDPHGSPPVTWTASGAGVVRRVLLLQVESLDLEPLRPGASASGCLPFLAAAVQGRLGSLPCRAIPLLAVHGVGGSADCEYAIWTGTQPSSSLPWWRIIDAPGGRTSLAWALADAGIPVHSYHGNAGSFFARQDRHERILGFAGHIDRTALGVPPGGWGSADHLFLDRVAERLAARPEPAWVAHVITFSTHAPFKWVGDRDLEAISPARFFRLQALGLRGGQRDYLRSLAYADAALEAFVARVEGWCDLILVYGDHPSGLEAPGLAGGSPWLDSGLVQAVPLLVAGRNLPVDLLPVASHLDLHATMADLLLPAGTAFRSAGRPLFRPSSTGSLPPPWLTAAERLAGILGFPP